MQKKTIFAILFYTFVGILVGYILFVKYLEGVRNTVYHQTAIQMQHTAYDIIEDKEKDTYIIALSLMLEEDAKTAILTHYTKHLKLKSLAKSFSHFLGFEHLWFQIITKEGVSIYRSWTEKRGDNVLKVREDIRALLQHPQTLSTVSVGKYTMSFKTIQPVWYHKELIGFVEVISKFDSVVDVLSKKGYEALVIIDKAYDKQLLESIRHTHYLGYRIATYKVSKELLATLQDNDLHTILKEPFVADEKNQILFTHYTIKNTQNEVMGYCILANHFSNIDMSIVDASRQKIIYIIAFLCLLLISVLVYLYTTKYKYFIENQNELLAEKVKDKTESLTFMALHDSLTKLPNRKFLLTTLRKKMRHAKKNNQTLFVLFLDLDNFKEINDAYGHQLGDKVLQKVSRRIASLLDSNAFFARVSGDEFVVVLEGWHKEKVESFLTIMLAEMKLPLYIQKTQLYIGISVGVSFFPVYGNTASLLLKEADTAMYVSKEKGKNRYHFYELWMEIDKKKRQELGKELRYALMHDEILVYFQPKISMKTEKIMGFEALVRWNHSTHGMMYPDSFLKLADELGLMEQFDNYVRTKSMEQMKRWKDQGLEPGMLCINISPREIEQEHFVANLERLCMETGFSFKDLEVEILENQIMENSQKVIRVLKTLRDLGVSIAIDDFGTGYSSFSYLQELPVQTLKIDKSFIKDLTEHNKSFKIVQMIIVLAKQLGLTVVAEGVETEEQFAILLQEECDIAQGYYIAKALSIEDAEVFMA